MIAGGAISSRLARVIAFASLAMVPLLAAGGPQVIPNVPSDYLPMTTLYRGATVYGTGKPVSVRFIHSTADWGNQLFLMDPRTGSENPLLLYNSSGHGKQCPDSGGVRAELGVFDSTQELVFMMRTISSNYPGSYCTGEACGPRYTGMNDPAKSKFYSSVGFSHMANHLWAEAARVSKSQVDSFPAPCAGVPKTPANEGGVIFSYNDGANNSYGDLVFLVTGVIMDVERVGTSPVVPGDSISRDTSTAPSACLIEASSGGVTQGETFTPRRMALPVSAILPRRSPTQSRSFMDQAWRLADPSRPNETQFPNGPDIRVTTPGPFAFNLGFFTNQGVLVNRAKGEVTAEMLANIEPQADGRRAISLMWYPAGENGHQASTGAYVVSGSLRTLPPKSTGGPGDRPAWCKDQKAELRSAFGYLRH